MIARFVRVLAIGAGLIYAQPAPKLEFEVASVRPSAPLNGQITAGVHIDGAQISSLLLSLKDYTRWAYKVKDYQILGPDWMAGARFDITAKVPAGTTPEQVAEMMGTLLADRFQMKLHRETKDLPIYALVVAKGGSKLQESPKDPPAADGDAKRTVSVVARGNSAGTTVDMGNGGFFSVGNNKIEGGRMTMAMFAETLARFVDRPVMDMTGLQANYDFTLEFSPEDFQAMMIRSAVIAGVAMPPEALKLLDSASGDTTLSALEKLGLKLEPRKAPIEVLVIDHLEKSPSDN
jgi:uncharacterized protein (TIGR03435 family)